MYTYNFALRFDDSVSQEIVNFSERLNKEIDKLFCLDSNSIPHATIVKFQIDNEIDNNLISQFEQYSKNTILVNFYGLSFLPSKNGGIWLEISILKNSEIVVLQENVVSLLNNAKLKNKVGDLYRPHVTIGKIKNDNLVNASLLDYSLLRKKQVLAKPSLGFSGPNFEFFSLTQ